MQRFGVYTFILLLLGAIACGEVKVPGTSDAGNGSGDASSGDCSPACGDNATCQNGSCECNSGFELGADGEICQAADACAVDNGGCDANATCVDAGAGEAACECNVGFAGDGLTCEDVDECNVNNGDCDPNATCTNISGGRICGCQPNFVGDGLVCREVWSLVGTVGDINLDPEGFGAIATSAGSRIYFGPRSNSAGARFMRSFDVQSGQFFGPHSMPPGSQTDFCACGLTSSFLSNGNELFLLGNDGMRYSPAADSWSSVLAYVDPFRRGEAAGTFDSNANAFLLVGGRSNIVSAIRFDVLAGAPSTFSNEPGTLGIGMDSAVAHTRSADGVTYVAGGDLNGGTGLISHVTGSDTWTRLADAPQGLGRAVGMGEFNGLVWVATRNGDFFFYDPATDTWNTTPLAAPAGFLEALMASGSPYVLVQNQGDVDVYRLSNIE